MRLKGGFLIGEVEWGNSRQREGGMMEDWNGRECGSGALRLEGRRREGGGPYRAVLYGLISERMSGRIGVGNRDWRGVAPEWDR